MKAYCKEKQSDCRDPDWPTGLYRRGESLRFRRTVRGELLMEIWGRMPVADAIRRAHRHNLDIEEGQNPVSKTKRDGTTFAGFAAEWLCLKASGLRRKSLVRYRAMVDHFQRFLTETKGSTEVMIAAVSVADASSYVQRRPRRRSCRTGTSA